MCIVLSCAFSIQQKKLIQVVRIGVFVIFCLDASIIAFIPAIDKMYSRQFCSYSRQFCSYSRQLKGIPARYNFFPLIQSVYAMCVAIPAIYDSECRELSPYDRAFTLCGRRHGKSDYVIRQVVQANRHRATHEYHAGAIALTALGISRGAGAVLPHLVHG